MATYTVSEARKWFSRLIDEALAGHEVVITRRGKPVVRLVARRDAAEPFPPTGEPRLGDAQ